MTSHVAIYNVTGFTAFQCLDNMSTGIGQCPCIRQIKSENPTVDIGSGKGWVFTERDHRLKLT